MSDNASAGTRDDGDTPDVDDREHGQTTLAEFTSHDTSDPETEEAIDTIVELLDRQLDVLEHVVDAVDAAPADDRSASASDGVEDATDHASRGFW